jgi:3-deoxy-D-manno-octulosonate 8-phosphate phosphatase (KDO 8-P phosphatase)
MKSISEKAKLVRLLALDVDGTLTTGSVYYGEDGSEMRGFHVHDGLGIKLAQQSGIIVAVISSKRSASIKKRMAELQIQHVYLGHEDKVPAYLELKQKLQLRDPDIAYMGDDLPDLPLLRLAGLSITVPGASALIKEHTDYITKHDGGRGAVREVCELLMDAQGKRQAVLESYLNAKATSSMTNRHDL